MPTPEQQSRWLEPGKLITLYELDLSGKISAFTNQPGPVLYFNEGINPTTGDIHYRGHIYTAMPIRAEGFELTTSGTLPRPKLTVSNIGGVVSALLREYDDFVGATLVVRRTFDNFLDGAANRGPPYQEFLPHIFVVNQKMTETNSQCAFDLATGMDAEGIVLPRRQILATACPWIYRGPECTYTGPPISDRLANAFGPRLDGCTIKPRDSSFTDGLTNWNSPQLASNFAHFTPDDVGKGISGQGIPVSESDPTVIISRQSPQVITMNHNPFLAFPSGGCTFAIAGRTRSLMFHPTYVFTPNPINFVGIMVTNDFLPKGTKISAIQDAHTVELDHAATQGGNILNQTIYLGTIGGPAGPIALWNANAVYDLYQGAYVNITQPGGGVIRMYAVSKVAGNQGHTIYDENFWMIDWCLKKQTDCQARFGVGNPLPYGGFPGANKLQ